MTVQENYELARAYLLGENGIQKDKAKALEYFKAAAEQGHFGAALSYAGETMAEDAKIAVELLRTSLPEKLKEEEAVVCLKALAYCVRQHPETKDSCVDFASSLVSAPHSTSRGQNAAYAEFLAVAKPEEAEEIKTRYRVAAMQDGWFDATNNITFDGNILKAYDFDHELVDASLMKEYAEWLAKKEEEAYSSDFYYKGTANRYVAIKKSEEFVREILKQQLSGDRPLPAVNVVSEKLWEQMKGLTSEPVLIYEKLRGQVSDMGTANFTYTYQEPNSITKHTGSGTVEIGKTYGVYEAEYLCEVADDDLMPYINGLEFVDFDQVPQTALLRAGRRPKKHAHAQATISGRMSETKDAVINEAAGCLLRNEYGWNSYYVKARSTNNRFDQWERAIYVPYYYFVYNVNGTKVTVRINAFDGTVTYFVNNEYGQIKSAEEIKQDGAAQTAGSGKRFKWWLIPIIAGGVLTVALIVRAFIEAM